MTVDRTVALIFLTPQNNLVTELRPGDIIPLDKPGQVRKPESYYDGFSVV